MLLNIEFQFCSVAIISNSNNPLKIAASNTAVTGIQCPILEIIDVVTAAILYNKNTKKTWS
jgi:hypothetical protein